MVITRSLFSPNGFLTTSHEQLDLRFARGRGECIHVHRYTYLCVYIYYIYVCIAGICPSQRSPPIGPRSGFSSELQGSHMGRLLPRHLGNRGKAVGDMLCLTIIITIQGSK